MPADAEPAAAGPANGKPAAATRVRLSVEDGGVSSHLSVRLDGALDAWDRELVVLYLHGFASSCSGTKADYFRRRFQELGLAVCSFDFQGHGDSGGTMRDLTLSRNLADLGRAHTWLRELEVQRVLIFGSSMGAATALWYAALHPRGVAATVSISPALEIEKSLLTRVGAEGAERWQRDGDLVLDHPLGAQELGWGLIEDLRAFDRGRLKSSYAVPALIFQGKHDDSVDWRTTVDFVTGCAFEGIDLHLMADGDHRLVDRLDHLWRLTTSFLEARDIV